MCVQLNRHEKVNKSRLCGRDWRQKGFRRFPRLSATTADGLTTTEKDSLKELMMIAGMKDEIYEKAVQISAFLWSSVSFNCNDTFPSDQGVP